MSRPAPLKIDNKTARRLWLAQLGLSQAPTGPLDTLSIIKNLGFVQLDTINNVTRAHHHILWSRNQNYREARLDKLLAKDRSVFEHFTHDASVLPMAFYPMWQRQFERLGRKVRRSEWYKTSLGPVDCAAIKTRIANEGPLCTQAFDTKIEGAREMWKRPPHKVELDKMWYAGELCTSHRLNFRKFYDLVERVIPDEMRCQSVPKSEQVHWLCQNALHRLGFAVPGEIQRFWDAVTVKEARQWSDNQAELVPVKIQNADKSRTLALAPADIEERLEQAVSPCGRLRLLNPFDPAIRDRNRLSRLFGFDYRIEIFVPAAKRHYGYYVYPLLEADRFVGRIELRADRKAGRINVVGFWPESKVKWGDVRFDKLQAELIRFARLSNLSGVAWKT